MLLLFTLLPKGKCFKNVLLKYDTNKKKGSLIEIKSNGKKIESTSGLVYSGNYLCVGVQYHKDKDSIVIFDTYSDKVEIYKSKSKNIGSIISIYPGKLYLDSQDTNSISCIDFDPVNLSYFSDDVHYMFDKKISSEIRSLCNYKNVWFIALQDKNKIVDLTNERIVYSDIKFPTSLFFNNNHRLCFIESGRNLFHCGDGIFIMKKSITKHLTTAIEDCNEGGYWITQGTDLHFINYDGDILKCLDLSKWGHEYYNAIEARGRFL